MDKDSNIGEKDLGEVTGGAGASGPNRVVIVNCASQVSVHSASITTDDNIIGYAYLGRSYLFYGWAGNCAKIDFNGGTGYVVRSCVELH